MTTPIVDTCPAGSALFADLDYVGARAAFEACVLADPSDGGAQLGLALSELLLLPDWAPVLDVLGRCGQPTDVTDQLYGPNGELDALGQEFSGSVSVTIDHVTDAGSTAMSVLSQPKVVYSDLLEYWIDAPPSPGRHRYIQIDIADSFSYANNLWMQLDLDDVYEDGSDVELTAGMVLDVADLSPHAVNLHLGCDQPGSSCAGWIQSSYQPEGTITVVSVGESYGDLIELELDLREPSWCAGGACSERWDIRGTVSDTLSVDYDLSWLP
ncbi:MAG TPA: hypothetical protein ENK18_23055, partial [Deltaproteobacteria bacterium]|nr:hypothetical protein [Deltaproteobacteria bacterium]